MEFTVNPIIINNLYNRKLISDEEFVKYLLSEDPNYLPPLIKEDER